MLNPIPMPNFVGSDCDDGTGHPCGGCPCGSGYPLTLTLTLTLTLIGSGYPGGNTEKDFPNPFGKDLMGKNTAIEDQVTKLDPPRGPAAMFDKITNRRRAGRPSDASGPAITRSKSPRHWHPVSTSSRSGGIARPARRCGKRAPTSKSWMMKKC